MISFWTVLSASWHEWRRKRTTLEKFESACRKAKKALGTAAYRSSHLKRRHYGRCLLSVQALYAQNQTSELALKLIGIADKYGLAKDLLSSSPHINVVED